MGCRNANANDEYISIPGNTAMQNSTEFSVSSWNKLNSTVAPNTLWKIMVWFGDRNLNIGSSDGILFVYDEERAAPPFDETWRWMHDGSDGDNENFWWQSFRAKTYWQNISYTFSSNNAPDTYWDADPQQAGTTPAPNDAGQETRDYRIGQHNGALSLQSDCRFNHFRWWNYKLPKQVMSWAVHRPSAIVEDLECYLPIWGKNTTETDISGNGHHGTVNNSMDDEPDGAPVFY